MLVSVHPIHLGGAMVNCVYPSHQVRVTVGIQAKPQLGYVANQYFDTSFDIFSADSYAGENPRHTRNRRLILLLSHKADEAKVCVLQQFPRYVPTEKPTHPCQKNNPWLDKTILSFGLDIRRQNSISQHSTNPLPLGVMLVLRHPTPPSNGHSGPLHLPLWSPHPPPAIPRYRSAPPRGHGSFQAGHASPFPDQSRSGYV